MVHHGFIVRSSLFFRDFLFFLSCFYTFPVTVSVSFLSAFVSFCWSRLFVSPFFPAALRVHFSMPPVGQTPAAHRPSSGNGSCRSTTWLSYGQGPCRGRRRRRITWGQDGTSCRLGWQNPNEENQLANSGKTGVFWGRWMILECQKMILEIWDDVGQFGDFGWIGWFRRRFSWYVLSFQNPLQFWGSPFLTQNDRHKKDRGRHRRFGHNCFRGRIASRRLAFGRSEPWRRLRGDHGDHDAGIAGMNMSFGHCFKSSLLNADDIKHLHILVIIKSCHHFTGIRMDFDIWLFESPKPWLGSMDVYSPRNGNNRSWPIPIYCFFLLKALNGAVEILPSIKL